MSPSGARAVTTRIVHVLAALAIIAVPILGWFVADWSGATTLLVYWFETVAGCLLVAARALLHRRWRPLRGYYEYLAAENGRRVARRESFVSGFLLVSLGFCAVHGVFLGAVLLILRQNGERQLAEIDWRSVGMGCATVLLLLLLDFAVDLSELRRWQFRQVEQLAYHGLGRVMVVHLTILVGFVGMGLTGASTALFGTFVALKGFFALGASLPQYDPVTPPKWLSALLNRVPNVRPGERFEDYWAKERADEAARRVHNEQPWPAGEGAAASG